MTYDLLSTANGLRVTVEQPPEFQETQQLRVRLSTQEGNKFATVYCTPHQIGAILALQWTKGEEIMNATLDDLIEIASEALEGVDDELNPCQLT